METGESITAVQAQPLLETMLGQPLQWAIKSPDLELFDVGFGGEGKDLPPFVIHAICPVKVVSHATRQVRVYQGNADAEGFRRDLEGLYGLSLRRVALSEKHDLWLDLGEYWLIFVTFEDGEESWRFFRPHQPQPHLVATDRDLELQ